MRKEKTILTLYSPRGFEEGSMNLIRKELKIPKKQVKEFGYHKRFLEIPSNREDEIKKGMIKFRKELGIKVL